MNAPLPDPPARLRLSAVARDRIAAAEIELQAMVALAELAHLLDPTGEMGRWATAGEIAERLRRFERAARARIRAGHREPRDTLEALLCAIAASGLPRSRRRLVDLLD